MPGTWPGPSCPAAFPRLLPVGGSGVPSGGRATGPGCATPASFASRPPVSRGAGEKGPAEPDFRSGRQAPAAGRSDQPLTDPSPRKARRARPGRPSGGGTTVAQRPRGARHRAPQRPPRGRPFPRARPVLHTGRAPARIHPCLGGQASSPCTPSGGADLTEPGESRVHACGPGRQASPPRRPASGPAATTPGRTGGAVPEATARGPRACPGPPSPPAAAGAPPAFAPPSPPSAPAAFPPSAALPARGVPPPAGRGPDLTRRAERSVPRPGPADGPPPGTRTAPGRPAATPPDPHVLCVLTSVPDRVEVLPPLLGERAELGQQVGRCLQRDRADTFAGKHLIQPLAAEGDALQVLADLPLANADHD